ncbi:MAG TPA: flagellar export chaperone FliS [bacterium]|nr:flagellar export chaperone FliS [bacterium]
MQQPTRYAAYRNTNVQTADQRQLILMLYDGLIRFLQKAAVKIEAREIEAAHNYLVRSREIVAELLATLRPEKAGEVGQNLKRLYIYAFNRIVEANLRKDAEIVQEVIRIASTLREGWSSVRPANAHEGAEHAAPPRVNVTR